jgi:hypothetical protein
MSALPLKLFWGRAALSIAILLFAVPAAMAEAFTPGSFQIFGGMDGASGDIAAAQRDVRGHARTLRSRVIDFASPWRKARSW